MAMRKLSCASAEQAQSDINATGQALSGQVSVGLAPGTGGVDAVACRCCVPCANVTPASLLYLNENFGTTLSELIMNGRMDMAVLYGGREVHGSEFFVAAARAAVPGDAPTRPLPVAKTSPLAELADMDMLLPRPYNVMRRMVDEAFLRIGLGVRVVAEIESSTTLDRRRRRPLRFDHPARVVGAGHVGRGPFGCICAASSSPRWKRRLALCLSGHLPLSVPAQAVKAILLELVAQMRGSAV